MREIVLDAHAKINLGLDITGIREDGYHLVDMVMQSVTLSDRIIIMQNDSSEIRLTSNVGYIPLNEHNLAYKAAKLMQEEFPGAGGVDIHIEKMIPVAAGLAGGSTDAASVMTGINELYGLGIAKEKLMEKAVRLGADVPYCIFGKTARAEGIGEIITAIRDLSECFILISKPSCSVSTAETYKRYDALTEVAHPDIEGMIRSINSGDLTGMAAKMGNVLEYVTEPIHPVIGDIKRVMRENGAISSMMSGSGPSVFGIFDDEEKLGIAKTRTEELGLCTENHACRPI